MYKKVHGKAISELTCIPWDKNILGLK